jgi:hypothetical protein
LKEFTPKQVNDYFVHAAHTPQTREQREEQRELTKRVLGEMLSYEGMEDALRNNVHTKSILDSTGGGTSGGSVMIRQDLEAPLIAQFVTQFPAYDVIPHGQSNGLVHAYNIMSAPDGNSLGSTAISELGNVGYNQTTLARQTTSIAVLATGRGVSFKEQAAVAAGGAPYNPLATEINNGLIVLSRDVQYYLFQGNGSYSSGTLTSEAGNYNANGFDGMRMILGAVASTNYSSDNAIQLDQGTLNLTRSIQSISARSADNGGHPNLVLSTMRAKEALDQENQDNRRYNDNQNEIIPGVRANQILAADGLLDILPCPGSTMGTYTSPTTGATVEDLYVIDTRHTMLRWLYKDGFTVLEIPSGVDNQLSSRYIIFGLWGLEINAPLFMGKVRRVYS